MARYTPGNPPDDPKALRGYLIEEQKKIAQAMDTPNQALFLEKLYAEPRKFREGTIVLADGIVWDPASGPGYYGYRDGAWRFLG